MIKIARLPNPTLAVADLDLPAPLASRLSRIPARRRASARSTGVEAMKMRAKYLVLAMALLCLLAVPSPARAASDEAGKIDDSVTTVLAGHRRERRRSRHRVHGPRRPGRGRTDRAQRRRDDDPGRLRRRRRVPDRRGDRRARRERRRRSHRGRQPGVRVRLRELDGHHQPGDRPGRGRGARGRRPVGRRRRRGDPRQRHRHHLRPRQQPHRRLEGLRQQRRRRRTTTPATAPSSPASSPATARRPCRSTRAATRRCSSAASRPAADIVGVKVLDETGQGRASSVIAGIALGHRPQGRVQHPRAQPLASASNPVAPADYDPIARAVEARLEERHHRRVRGRQRGRVRPRRHPLPRQQPLRHHRGRHRHAADRVDLDDDAVTFYSSVGPTLFDEIRQARPGGARQPARSRCACRAPTSTSTSRRT